MIYLGQKAELKLIKSKCKNNKIIRLKCDDHHAILQVMKRTSYLLFTVLRVWFDWGSFRWYYNILKSNETN